MKIKIVNKRFYKGNGIYVGRPSILGNPYTHIKDKKTKAEFIVSNRDEAVERYREWIKEQWRSNPFVEKELFRITEIAIKNDEVTLICWCSPLRCHCEYVAKMIIYIAQKYYHYIEENEVLNQSSF